jgi:hypothetical protein
MFHHNTRPARHEPIKNTEKMCPELKEEEEEEEIHKAHRVLQWHHFMISKDDNAVTTNKTPAARTTTTPVPKLFKTMERRKMKIDK